MDDNSRVGSFKIAIRSGRPFLLHMRCGGARCKVGELKSFIFNGSAVSEQDATEGAPYRLMDSISTIETARHLL